MAGIDEKIQTEKKFTESKKSEVVMSFFLDLVTYDLLYK